MLPVVDNRSFDVFKLPYLKEKIKIKPYKGSQEKVLLTCLADKSDRTKWLENITQIMKDNLVETELNFDTLKIIDFMFICFKLRSISKSQVFEYSFRCPGHLIDENNNEIECSHIFKEADTIDTLLNIKNINVEKIQVEVNDKLSLELVPPSINYLKFLSDLSDNDFLKYEDSDEQSYKDLVMIRNNFEMFCNKLAYSVSKVIITENNKPTIYTDFTIDELNDKILLNLTIAELKKIIDESNKLINLSIRLKKHCPVCKSTFEKEDTNFFAFLT
jgi:hypothetical protein